MISKCLSIFSLHKSLSLFLSTECELDSESEFADEFIRMSLPGLFTQSNFHI